MRLFHVSEDPNIEKFILRMPDQNAWEIERGVVWAIDEEHLTNYLTPRNCPRIVLRIGNNTTIEDIRAFDLQPGIPVIYLEKHWQIIMQNHPLYLYEFEEVNFECVDKTAGYYVSYEEQPAKWTMIVNDLEDFLRARGVTVRYIERLNAIYEQIIQSSLDFSCIRMRYAKE